MSAPDRTSGPDAQRQLASLPLAVVLLSPGQRIASVNPAAEQFFGQSLRRLKGKRLADTISFDEPRLAERMTDSETPVSAREINVTVAGQGSYTVKAFPADRKKIDIGVYYSDGRLIAKKLGWKPRTTIKQALALTVDYYRKQLPYYL